MLSSHVNSLFTCICFWRAVWPTFSVHGIWGLCVFCRLLLLFSLAIIHLVLVHGWVVLLVGPLVPGLRPWEAGTPVTFSLLFLLGPISCAGGMLLGPLSFGSLCFHVFLPLLDWVSCFRFFSGLFCFIFQIPGRALAHARSRTLAPAHTLPLARGRVWSCLPIWAIYWAFLLVLPLVCSVTAWMHAECRHIVLVPAFAPPLLV